MVVILRDYNKGVGEAILEADPSRRHYLPKLVEYDGHIYRLFKEHKVLSIRVKEPLYRTGPFYVYSLYEASWKAPCIYVGATSNPFTRLSYHRANRFVGARMRIMHTGSWYDMCLKETEEIARHRRIFPNLANFEATSALAETAISLSVLHSAKGVYGRPIPSSPMRYNPDYNHKPKVLPEDMDPLNY